MHILYFILPQRSARNPATGFDQREKFARQHRHRRPPRRLRQKLASRLAEPWTLLTSWEEPAPATLNLTDQPRSETRDIMWTVSGDFFFLFFFYISQSYLGHGITLKLLLISFRIPSGFSQFLNWGTYSL